MAHKLLLADDSITIQKVVELTLSEEDFDVTAVGDGDAALEAARTLMPDIILADVFMPKMDGYELCGKLKQDPALRGIPVVLLAGTFENFDEARAAQVGAAGHLTKPFESGELISKVRRLVDQTGPAAGAAPAAPAASPSDEPFAEAAFAEDVEEASPADAADDLWSVVDMGSPGQPLAGATAAISEDDLWKRANLLADSGETAAFPREDNSLWADVQAVEPELAGEMVEDEMMAAEVEDEFPEATLDDTPASDRTAVLDMDSLNLSAYAQPRPLPEPEPVELAEFSGPSEFMAFEGLHQATLAEEHTMPPAPLAPSHADQPAAARPVASAGPSLSPEMIREEVARAVGDLLDMKIKEALAGLSSEMIEKVVWEVVPDLAEEILVKEIDRLKAGTS